MPWADAPRTDFDEDVKFHWEAWLVGLPMECLFGQLHERFNTATLFIQKPENFHRDVAEIVRCAQDQKDFYNRMQVRKDERVKELTKMFQLIPFFIISRHFDQVLKEKQKRILYELVNKGSLDSLLDFCLSFLGPDNEGHHANIDNYFPTANLSTKPQDTRLTTSEESHSTATCPDTVGSNGWETEVDAEEQHLGWPKRRKRKAPSAENDQPPRKRYCQGGNTNPSTRSSRELPSTYADAATQTVTPGSMYAGIEHPNVTRNAAGRFQKAQSALTRKRKLSGDMILYAANTQSSKPLSNRAIRAQRRAEAKAQQTLAEK